MIEIRAEILGDSMRCTPKKGDSQSVVDLIGIRNRLISMFAWGDTAAYAIYLDHRQVFARVVDGHEFPRLGAEPQTPDLYRIWVMKEKAAQKANLDR